MTSFGLGLGLGLGADDFFWPTCVGTTEVGRGGGMTEVGGGTTEVGGGVTKVGGGRT